MDAMETAQTICIHPHLPTEHIVLAICHFNAFKLLHCPLAKLFAFDLFDSW